MKIIGLFRSIWPKHSFPLCSASASSPRIDSLPFNSRTCSALQTAIIGLSAAWPQWPPVSFLHEYPAGGRAPKKNPQLRDSQKTLPATLLECTGIFATVGESPLHGVALRILACRMLHLGPPPSYPICGPLAKNTVLSSESPLSLVDPSPIRMRGETSNVTTSIMSPQAPNTFRANYMI